MNGAIVNLKLPDFIAHLHTQTLKQRPVAPASASRVTLESKTWQTKACGGAISVVSVEILCHPDHGISRSTIW